MTSTPDPTAPPPAPRDLTPLVRRRAWAEKRVRGWWLLALVMLVICAYYAASRLYRWNQDRNLIATGQRVDAEVMGWAPGYDAPKHKVVQPEYQVDLLYTYNGKTYRPYGLLAGRKEPVLTRTMVPIIIDPNDPTRWTARLHPAPLAHELLPAFLLLPFAVVPFAIALLARRRVLRIYRDGEPILAQVVGVGHAAAAPFSRMVRCALHTDTDARVIKTLLPARKTPPPGQTLWLLAPPARPQQALPAALFE